MDEEKVFKPFENLYLTSKICGRPCSQMIKPESKSCEDLISSVKFLDLEYDEIKSPKLSSDHLFDKNNREHFLISCNDCVNYMEKCVSRRVMRMLDDGKRWDFDLYRRNLESNRSLIRLRFCMIIQRIVKELPNKEKRQIKRSKKNDPYKNFMAANSIGNQLEFLKRTLRTCQTRQKVLAMFRNAVLKVVWDFHVKNNEPWRYIMFYWKIIVDKELRLASLTTLETNGPDEHRDPNEPFHSLIAVAKTYVDTFSSKVNADDDDAEFRVPDHWTDEEQEKFYKFYDNYLSERIAAPQSSINDAFDEFRQKTFDAVQKYNKIQPPNDESTIDDGQKFDSSVGIRNVRSQSLIKKRVQRMNLAPVNNNSSNEGQINSSPVNEPRVTKKPPLLVKGNAAKNSLAPPSILNSPTDQRRKLSLPDVTKTSATTPQTPRNRKKLNSTGEIQGKKWNQFQIIIPRAGRKVGIATAPKNDGTTAMTNVQKFSKPLVTPHQLHEIVERLRRPLDRSVKSKALRQLLRKENANFAKKRVKPEREVMQIVDRLSTLSEKSSFDYSDHVDFEKSLRKYDLLNSVFRRKSNNTTYSSSHQLYVDHHSDEDENAKLLKNRKSTKNPRLYGSNKSINDDTDLITIEEVRPRTQSQKNLS